MRKIAFTALLIAAAMFGAGIARAVSTISSPSISILSSIGDLPITRGTVTLNGATPVTVAAPLVTANSDVNFTLKTIGGTVGAAPAIQTITPGTGFTVSGSALDTSTYNFYVIF